jgi:hypothetical protein
MSLEISNNYSADYAAEYVNPNEDSISSEQDSARITSSGLYTDDVVETAQQLPLPAQQLPPPGDGAETYNQSNNFVFVGDSAAAEFFSAEGNFQINQGTTLPQFSGANTAVNQAPVDSSQTQPASAEDFMNQSADDAVFNAASGGVQTQPPSMFDQFSNAVSNVDPATLASVLPEPTTAQPSQEPAVSPSGNNVQLSGGGLQINQGSVTVPSYNAPGSNLEQSGNTSAPTYTAQQTADTEKLGYYRQAVQSLGSRSDQQSTGAIENMLGDLLNNKKISATEMGLIGEAVATDMSKSSIEDMSRYMKRADVTEMPSARNPVTENPRPMQPRIDEPVDYGFDNEINININGWTGNEDLTLNINLGQMSDRQATLPDDMQYGPFYPTEQPETDFSYQPQNININFGESTETEVDSSEPVRGAPLPRTMDDSQAILNSAGQAGIAMAQVDRMSGNGKALGEAVSSAFSSEYLTTGNANELVNKVNEVTDDGQVTDAELARMTQYMEQIT